MGKNNDLIEIKISRGTIVKIASHPVQLLESIYLKGIVLEAEDNAPSRKNTS